MDTTYFLKSAHDRVLGLGLERSVIVALACAQKLAADNTDPEISAALAMGRDLDIEAKANELERRPDVDSDVVAATIFALRASLGSVDSANEAWWAVSRFIDAAFDRAQYDEGEMTFRPLDEDAAQPGVKRELDWLEQTLTLAEATEDPHELARQLRAP